MLTSVGWETGVAVVDIKAGSARRMWGRAKRGVKTWRSMVCTCIRQAGRQDRHMLA